MSHENIDTEYRNTHLTTYCRLTHTQTHAYAQVPKIPIQHRRVQLISTGNCSGCYDNPIPQKAQKAEKTKAPRKKEQNTNFKDRKETRTDKKGRW